MDIKEVINNFMGHGKDRKVKMQEFEENIRIQKNVEQRMKTPNERDLEKYHEEERQKLIKNELDKFKQQRTREQWTSNIFKQKNVFQGHKNILQDNKKMFTGKINKVKSCGYMK